MNAERIQKDIDFIADSLLRLQSEVMAEEAELTIGTAAREFLGDVNRSLDQLLAMLAWPVVRSPGVKGRTTVWLALTRMDLVTDTTPPTNPPEYNRFRLGLREGYLTPRFSKLLEVRGI